MPALAFGLNAAKPQSTGPRPPQKRKAFFDQDDDDNSESETAPPPQYGTKKPSRPLRPLTGFAGDDTDEDNGTDQPPRKSPKLSQPGLQNSKAKTKTSSAPSAEKYVNLSALRTAKLHDEEASRIDTSVYDYDAVYDTFHAAKEKKSASEVDSKPKYMTSLMESAEVRKRDQLRAKEKLLQREREAEGDEFADKEKFVTQAYKKQQEEVRIMEEEEKKREEAEEERRRKGGGMTAFHKRMLEKEEERMRLIAEAEEAALQRKVTGHDEHARTADERSDAKIAEELNDQGARIIVNDDGEVVDKRQLLSAGLNAAPKKPGKQDTSVKAKEPGQQPEYWRSSKAQDARSAQRERQTRMMERQIEEMAEKQQQAELAEQREQQDKIKSKVSEADKMGARERFLQRKKEREEEARRKKEGGG